MAEMKAKAKADTAKRATLEEQSPPEDYVDV
jgi:hypothetical protein